MSQNPKLIDKWSRGLAEPARNVISALLDRADSGVIPTYLVGGPVRDLLLGRDSRDVDIVVEEDAIALARRLESHPDVVRVVTHPAFGTATLRLEGAHVDLITARSETYTKPGALPSVTPGTIADDLARRDFTINTMALRLTGRKRGELLDPFGGRGDLEAKLIRALHEGSFRDDPTRILRAARYAGRFGFRIEPEAEEWIRRDAGFLVTISAPRLHRELSRILAEDEPERTLACLQDLGALHAIDAALRFNGDAVEAFRTLREVTSHPSQAAMWALLLWSAHPHETGHLAHRLALTGVQRHALAEVPAAKHAAKRLSRASRPQEIVHLMSPLPEPTLWALAAVSRTEIQDKILDFLRRLRHVRPLLTGDDLIALGVQRGPCVAEVLDLIRLAKLGGTANTREDEVRIVDDYRARTS